MHFETFENTAYFKANEEVRFRPTLISRPQLLSSEAVSVSSLLMWTQEPGSARLIRVFRSVVLKMGPCTELYEEPTYWKRPDAGEDLRQKEKGATEDEMASLTQRT